MLSFLFSCSPSPKAAREKFTVPDFVNTGQLRTDGFYYRIAGDTLQANTEVGKYFVSTFYLYNNGTAHYGSGFSTNDTSLASLKAYAETSLAASVEQVKAGWGRYSINAHAIELEYFFYKRKGFSSLGLIRLTGVVVNDSAIIIERSFCSWCDGRPPEQLYKPAKQYTFMKLDVVPDSAKAFFKK